MDGPLHVCLSLKELSGSTGALSASFVLTLYCFFLWVSGDPFLIEYVRPSVTYSLLIRARTEVGLSNPPLTLTVRTADISEFPSPGDLFLFSILLLFSC